MNKKKRKMTSIREIAGLTALAMLSTGFSELMVNDNTAYVSAEESSTQVTGSAAESEGELFQTRVGNDEVSIVKCNNKNAEKIEIPSQINGLPVTTLEGSAFMDMKNLKEIIIPDSVKQINRYCFSGCEALEEITIPESVTDISERAFDLCRSLKTVRLPSGIISISSNAFYNCISLSDINFPDSLEIIKGGAFENCTSLGEVKLPESLKKLGISAFEKSGITKLEICSDIEEWGTCSFRDCEKLKEVIIHEGTVTIGDAAFNKCRNLEKVEFSSTVRRIEREAFEECGSLTDVKLNDGLEYIGNSAFSKTSFTSVDIPDSVTDIGFGAFFYDEQLEDVKIPANLQHISSLAFAGTKWFKNNFIEDNTLYYLNDDLLYLSTYGSYPSLSTNDYYTVEIKEGTKYIAGSAFESCYGIGKVNIPDSVEYIGDWAFKDCSSLRSITIPDGVTKLNGSTFDSCYRLSEVNLPNNLEEIGSSDFKYCTALKETEIPSSVKKIGSSAFERCDVLEKVVLNEGLETIESRAFFDDEVLKDITIPSTVKKIGYLAFGSCYSLESVVLPEGLEEIDSQTFSACKALKKITIPASVHSIYKDAFEGSENVVIYGYEGSYAQYYAENHDIEFVVIGNASDVPGSTEGDTADHQEKDGITYRVNGNDTVEFVKYTGSDTKVVIPETIDGKTVTSVSSGAFEGCTEVSEISVPKTVNYIGYNAFTDTKWLDDQKKSFPLKYPMICVNNILIDATSLADATSTDLFSDTKAIAGGAFENCTGLEEVTINDGVTYIGEKAFYNCSGLTKLTVPDSVTSIEKDAFAGCKNLVIYGNKNSYIQKYASENKIRFAALPDPVKNSGDINADGNLDVMDVLTVKQWFIGAKELNDAQLAAADLNADGKLNIADMCLLKEKILSGNYSERRK